MFIETERKERASYKLDANACNRMCMLENSLIGAMPFSNHHAACSKQAPIDREHVIMSNLQIVASCHWCHAAVRLGEKRDIQSRPHAALRVRFEGPTIRKAQLPTPG
eukprot:366444-Chlamydomonas_euryale.AAC.3